MTEPQQVPLPKAILFLDFDGTITRRDAVDAILETYADPEWLEFEAQWRAGRRVPALLREARVCAGRLEARGRLWCTEFPYFHQTCGHGCATCKPAVMRLLNTTNAPVIFVGDGLSDQYAVESADLVFAKNQLAGHCREHSIEHTSYSDLGNVASHLDSWLVARRFAVEETKARVSA